MVLMINESSDPGLKIQLKTGVNVLVGENDSRKITIIDTDRGGREAMKFIKFV